jgi:hypothetical protein
MPVWGANAILAYSGIFLKSSNGLTHHSSPSLFQLCSSTLQLKIMAHDALIRPSQHYWWCNFCFWAFAKLTFLTIVKVDLPRISMSAMSDIQHCQSIQYANIIQILMYIFDIIRTYILDQRQNIVSPFNDGYNSLNHAVFC